MKIDKRNFIIQILSFIGFCLTIKLAMIYYVANYEKYALASFCSINDFIDCDGAAKTTVSQFLGIPLAYWGMVFYLLTLFLTLVDKLKNIKLLKFLEVFKNPLSYITVIGSFAFITSMILAGISIWGIKKLCILCVVTYFIDLLIAIIPVKNIKEYFDSFKITVIDFTDGIKKYPKTFVILLISVIAFLSFSNVTCTFVPHIKKAKQVQEFMQMKKNPYAIKGNILGAKKADVIIELYSDFVCPMCYIHNLMIHKAVSEYSNIRVNHHNFPFDKECNPGISFNMHPGACYMAKAAIAAKNQGNYWGMSSLLYEEKPLNDEDLLNLAQDLKFDTDKFFADLSSKKVSDELQKELEQALLLNLDSTPTTFINGEKIVGLISYDELKEILEKHGAKRK